MSGVGGLSKIRPIYYRKILLTLKFELRQKYSALLDEQKNEV